MPETVAGVHQAGYIDAVAPEGTHVDLQFLDNANAATKELNAIRARQPSYPGLTVGNGQSLAPSR